MLGVKAKVKERKAKTRRRRAICKRINGTAAGTIQECGDLEETQEILAFLNVLSLSFCLYLYLRLFSVWFSILFSLSKPFYMRPPCFNVHCCCNDETLFTKQTLQISSKPGTSWVSQKYLGSKDFKSYLKTFLMIQHLYKMTNELYTNMIYLSFLFNQDSILLSVNWIHNFVEALSSQDQSKIWIRILSSDPVFFTSPIYSAILAVFAINSNFPWQNTLEQDCL